jgi:hypothetical protein
MRRGLTSRSAAYNLQFMTKIALFITCRLTRGVGERSFISVNATGKIDKDQK